MSDKEYVSEFLQFLEKKRDDGSVSAQRKHGIEQAISILKETFELGDKHDEDPPIEIPNDDDPPIEVPDDDDPPVEVPFEEPTKPTKPTSPTGPTGPTSPTGPTAPTQPTQPNDIENELTQATSLGPTDLSSIVQALRDVVDASTPLTGAEQSVTQNQPTNMLNEYVNMISVAQTSPEFNTYFDRIRDIMYNYMNNPKMQSIYNEPEVAALHEQLGGDMERTYQALLVHPKYGPVLSQYQEQMTQSMSDTMQTFMATPQFGQMVENINLQNWLPEPQDQVEGGSLKK